VGLRVNFIELKRWLISNEDFVSVTSELYQARQDDDLEFTLEDVQERGEYLRLFQG